MIAYSLVIPVHNEAGNLSPLMKEIDAVRLGLGRELEVVFVDDGSADGSFEELESLKQTYAYIRLIKLDANYGQTAGFAAGFAHARGEVIITMDADGQNNPADIPNLLSHYPEYDVVIGRRVGRQDSFVKLISSRIANAIRNKLTADSVSDTGCSLKLFKTAYAKRLVLYNGMHRFLPTLCKLEGARVIEVPVSHRPRVSGQTHYGIGNRAFSAFKDACAVRWMKQRKLAYKIERIVE